MESDKMVTREQGNTCWDLASFILMHKDVTLREVIDKAEELDVNYKFVIRSLTEYNVIDSTLEGYSVNDIWRDWYR